MKTSRKYLVGAGVLAAIGGALWWNRYVILRVSPEHWDMDQSPTWTTVRAYRFTAARARAAAIIVGAASSAGDSVYVTHHRKVVYNVYDASPQAVLTADVENYGMPLSGLYGRSSGV